MNLQPFEIRLVALANVSARITVQAENRAEAVLKAIQQAQEGDVVWTYDGISDDCTIEEGV